MEQANEPAGSMSDMPIAGHEAPESVDSSTYGPPPLADQGQTPGISPDPDVPGFAPPPTYAPPAYGPPSVGSPPPGVGQDPYQYYGQGYPTAPRPRNKRKLIIILASVGTAVVLLVAVLVTLGLGVFKHLNSTANVRVIVPPPARAGGLNQDFVDESKPLFKQDLVTVRQTFTAELHGKFTSYALALYSNAPVNTSADSATVSVLYVGLNSSSNDYDTAGALKAALAGSAARMSSVTTLPITSGPGNTSYGCETGTLAINPAALCAWTTDHTLGFLFEIGPNADVTKLAALEKKMEPDLVQG